MSYIEGAEARLISHRSNGDLGGFILGMIDSVESVSTDVSLMTALNGINEAEGDSLDKYASQFGVARSGLSDDVLRLAIRTRIASLHSKGNLASVYLAVSQSPSLVDADIIKVSDVYPAGLVMEISYPDDQIPGSNSVNEIGRILDAATSACIATGLLTSMQTYFGFLGDPDASGFDVGMLSSYSGRVLGIPSTGIASDTLTPIPYYYGMVLSTSLSGASGLAALTSQGPSSIGQYGITDTLGTPQIHEWNGSSWDLLGGGSGLPSWLIDPTENPPTSIASLESSSPASSNAGMYAIVEDHT